MGIQQVLLSYGAAAPAFPQVLSITQTSFGADTTNHSANYPSTVNSGDLLLYMVTARVASGNVDVTTPSGLTLVATQDSGNISTTPVSLYSRIADGTEGGGTVNFVTSVAAHMAVQIWRIQSASYSGAILNAATFTVGSPTVDPPPVTISPASSALVIGWFGSNGTAAPTSYSLPDNQTTTASGGTNVCRVITSSTNQASSGTADPGVYTMATSTNSGMFTTVIRSV